MASFLYYDSFLEDWSEGVIKPTDTFKVFLTNTAHSTAHAAKADLTEIANGNGYTTGGNTASVTSSTSSGGTYKLVLGSPAVWTASGGSIGPLRGAVLYSDTSTGDRLVGRWDYGGSSITVPDTETLSVSLSATNGVFTIAKAA